MAKEFLDYTGLTLYDQLIKNVICEGDEKNAAAIASYDERILVMEGSVSSLFKVTNKLRGRVEKILTTLDEGVAIIEELSGDTYYVTSGSPMEDDVHTLVTSSGIYKLVNARTAFIECNDVGRTGDPNIEIDLEGYDIMDGGGYMVAKMSNALHTAEYTYLNINDRGNYRLYFNGQPACETNSWDDGEMINIWFDGQYYQSTHAFSSRKASELEYADGVSVADKIAALDEKDAAIERNLSTLSSNTANAISALRQKDTELSQDISNLSAATKSAVSALTNSINTLSANTNNRINGVVSAFTAADDAIRADLSATNENVSTNAAAIEAISQGAKVTMNLYTGATTTALSCVYKGEASEFTIKATLSEVAADKIEIHEDSDTGTLIASANTSTTSVKKTYTLTGDKKFFGKAFYKGAKFKANTTMSARYSIIYGFGNANDTGSISEATINNCSNIIGNGTTTSHRLSARTSAVTTYSGTASANSVHFYILVPTDINNGNLSTFTMGGAPYVMNNKSVEINGVAYKMYRSGAIYNSGASVSIAAS